MKRRFTRKLFLNKKTVIKLQNEDMKLIRGASIVWVCTESCSIVHICCDTKTNQIDENQLQAKDQE